MATFTWQPDPLPSAPSGELRVAIKDLIDWAGTVTTSGSRVLAATATPAVQDAPCLAGLRAAVDAGRAVVVGKTNLHELAYGVTGINPWFGTPVNPLDPTRVPGGSSSGSGVAVATGEADIAIGSDTGGSIRIPAACCGIVGLKTTRGRIDLHGVRPLAPSLDTIGPMAADVPALVEGMELLEPGFSVKGHSPAASIGRFRPPAAAWVDAALDAALDRMAAATGCEVVEVEIPGWAAATTATMEVMSAEAWAVNGDLWRAHAAELSPDVAQRLELSALIGAEEVAAAWEQAREWRRRLDELFGQVDLIALPVLADEPPPLDHAAQLTAIRYVAPFNLSGTPALALPVRTDRPIPASLQLAGPAGSEEMLVTTALHLAD